MRGLFALSMSLLLIGILSCRTTQHDFTSQTKDVLSEENPEPEVSKKQIKFADELVNEWNSFGYTANNVCVWEVVVKLGSGHNGVRYRIVECATPEVAMALFEPENVKGTNEICLVAAPKGKTQTCYGYLEPNKKGVQVNHLCTKRTAANCDVHIKNGKIERFIRKVF